MLFVNFTDGQGRKRHEKAVTAFWDDGYEWAIVKRSPGTYARRGDQFIAVQLVPGSGQEREAVAH